MVLSIFAHLGAVLFSLRAHDDIEHVQIGDLWNPAPFWRFLGTEIIFSIAVFVGLLLLVVPGIILALGFGFAFYIVVERGAGPIKSLEESWRITRGYKWQLLGLTLAIIGINLLGAIAFLVGLLVSVPVSWLAITHAYRTLQARAG